MIEDALKYIIVRFGSVQQYVVGWTNANHYSMKTFIN